MRSLVNCFLLLAPLFAQASLAQPVVWQESSAATIRMLPEAPDSRTPITFLLVKTCDPLDMGSLELNGSEVRLELWGSDYCQFHDSPHTETRTLGVLSPGPYTVNFHYCEDLPSPYTYECHLASAQGFTVTEARIRRVPFAALGTLLMLPLLLLFVAARVAPRR